jgi:8-oxo-dGTP diphosphatase
MKLLAELTERSLNLGDEVERLGGMYELRKSARAVLSNGEGKIALQHLTKYNFYKLPGGGINIGESPEAAVVRELREEVGATAVMVRPVGVVIEYRNTLLHISYAYHLKLEGDLVTPTLEQGEIEEGQETVWLSPEEALAVVRSSAPEKFEGHFIIAREQAFLDAFISDTKAP